MSNCRELGQAKTVIGRRQTKRFLLPSLSFVDPFSAHLDRHGGEEVLPDAAAEPDDPNALPRLVCFEKGFGNQRFAPAPNEEDPVESKSSGSSPARRPTEREEGKRRSTREAQKSPPEQGFLARKPAMNGGLLALPSCRRRFAKPIPQGRPT